MKTYKEYKDMGRFNEGQMEEIRLGLEKDIDVSIYAKPEFDCGQMEEMCLGLEKGLVVSIYAKPEYKSYAMRHDASENLLVNL